ncbi:transmembrane protein 52-like [Rhinoraja longicauda]
MASWRPLLTATVCLLCLLQATVTRAQTCGQGEDDSCRSHWTHLWYVWLILLTVFLLLVCGVTASCIKCCRRSKPQAPTFANRPYEVTVIAIDNDSSITPNSTLQYISTGRNHISLRDPSQLTLPPPSYSVCTIDNPPTYEMALKMAKAPETSDPTNGAENPNGNGAQIPQRIKGPGPTDGTVAPSSLASS